MQITVVVPVYNSAATILRSLESIAAQTRPPAAVVLVDDQSTDDSIALAESLNLPNLCVVAQASNMGPGAARNAGAATAATDWLAFLDADDTWEPTFLEDLAAAIVHNDADYASGGGLRTVRRQVDRRLHGDSDEIVLGADFWRVALRFQPIHPSSFMVRRSLFETAGGFQEDIRNGEDVSLWARLWLYGRFVFVDRHLFNSVAPIHGLNNAPISYRDLVRAIVPLARTVGRSIVMRKPGSQWFVVWYARAVFRRHIDWLRRRRRAGIDANAAPAGVSRSP